MKTSKMENLVILMLLKEHLHIIYENKDEKTFNLRNNQYFL